MSTFLESVAILSGIEAFSDQKGCCLKVWGKLELGGKGEKPFLCAQK